MQHAIESPLTGDGDLMQEAVVLALSACRSLHASFDGSISELTLASHVVVVFVVAFGVKLC